MKNLLGLVLLMLIVFSSCKDNAPGPQGSRVVSCSDGSDQILQGKWYTTAIMIYTRNNTPVKDHYDSAVYYFTENYVADTAFVNRVAQDVSMQKTEISGYSCTEVYSTFLTQINHNLYYTIVDSNTVNLEEVYNDANQQVVRLTLKRVPR